MPAPIGRPRAQVTARSAWSLHLATGDRGRRRAGLEEAAEIVERRDANLVFNALDLGTGAPADQLLTRHDRVLGLLARLPEAQRDRRDVARLRDTISGKTG